MKLRSCRQVDIINALSLVQRTFSAKAIIYYKTYENRLITKREAQMMSLHDGKDHIPFKHQRMLQREIP